MRETGLLLDTVVQAPPEAVMARLAAAAAATAPIAGQRLAFTADEGGFDIIPTTGDYKMPRAQCRGLLLVEGSATRLRLLKAQLPPGGPAVLFAMAGCAVLLSGFVGLEMARAGNVRMLWLPGAFVLGFCLILALVAHAAVEIASDEARLFVRRALREAETVDPPGAG
jgi:hypothetical protein